MFQVFVDSAANLPAVTAKKYDIHVVSFVKLEWKRAGLLRPGSVTGRGACKRKRILQCHAHRL